MREAYVKAAGLLENAARAIELRGHAKKVMEDEVTGGLCAMGALSFVETGDGYSLFQRCHAQLPHHVRLAVAALTKYVGVGVPAWNDRPERTPEEVTSALRTAAVMLRMKGATYEAENTDHEQGVQVHAVEPHGPQGHVPARAEGAGGRGRSEGRPGGRAERQGAGDRRPEEVGVYT